MTIFDANRDTCIIKVFDGWWLARMVKNRGFPVFIEYGISVHRPSWPLSDMWMYWFYATVFLVKFNHIKLKQHGFRLKCFLTMSAKYCTSVSWETQSKFQKQPWPLISMPHQTILLEAKIFKTVFITRWDVSNNLLTSQHNHTPPA